MNENAAVVAVAQISVNGDVLKWARNERGFDRRSAARLLGIPEVELEAYEGGYKKPLVTLLRRMADKYEIAYVSLFLPEPPAPLPKIHDFRTLTAGVASSITHETAVAIQDVRDALERFAEMRAEDETAVSLPRLEMIRPKESPEDLAARMRRRFGVRIEDQQGWSLSFARDEWRRRIEAVGVFVYLKPMNLNDCRGFSMIHEGLAAICINDREESAGAETFTLWHEFCHLLRRQGGISDENRYNPVERYCNLFAASFLIPKTKLREILNSPTKPTVYGDSKVKQLANRFKVSNRAMALRLESTGLAPRGFYSARTAAWDVPKVRPKATAIKGPTAVQRAARVFGRHHTKTVLRAYKSGLLTGADAHHMLDVPIPAFGRLGLVVE
jgi:Zn-dependent peptidase ImmA (M78 family)